MIYSKGDQPGGLFAHQTVGEAFDKVWPELVALEGDLPAAAVQLGVGEEKGFNEDRVKSGAEKLKKNLKTAQQSRLEGFFKPVQRTKEEQEKLKRKQEEKVQEAKKKKKEEAKEKKAAKAKPRGTGAA